MNKIINFFKSFIGILLFYSIHIIVIYTASITNIHSFNIVYFSIDTLLVTSLFLLYKKEIIHDFKDFDKNYKKYIKVAIKPYIIGILIMMISNIIINKFIINTMAYNEQLDRLVIFKYPLYSVIAMIITGPFIEEITFRLGFKKYINNKYLYYFLATFVFAFIHAYNGIKNPIELIYLIPYGSVSLAFTYILDKTNNIFTNIIIHLMHNTITIYLLVSIMLIGV